MNNIIVPFDVPDNKRTEFIDNYQALTHQTDRFFIYSCDHKIEHLNSINPHHLFTIAKNGNVGAMATHLGLLHRYGGQYKNVNYIVKLNATTLLRAALHDPVSTLLWDVDQVIQLKKTSHLAIGGIGITVYLGSAEQDLMLAQAAQVINHAHHHGLVAIVWMYPRGSGITNTSLNLLAGCAGVATSLGADIVKLKPHENIDWINSTLQSAGNTKVVCAGLEKIETTQLLKNVEQYLQAGIAGMAIGRNIFEYPLDQAIETAQAIAKIIYEK